MSTFWSSAFNYPNPLFPPTHQPIFNDMQGVNYPPAWPLPCYSQYHQPAAAIRSLESVSSSSSEDEDNGPQASSSQNRPTTSARSPPSPQRPSPSQPRSTKRPLTKSATVPSPNRKQVTRPSSQPQTRNLDRAKSQHAVMSHVTSDLRHFITQSPGTFSVVSTSALKRERPANWRQDYFPPSASWFKRRLLGIRAIMTDEPTYLNTRALVTYTRPVLNSLLRYPSPPPLTYFFDLRCNPFSAYLLHLPNSNGPVNHVHLLQVGSTPPAHDLRLWHHRVPWTIIVRSTHSNGILVSDILGNIYAQLMMPISSQDYYNESMTADDRERVETAYKVRCNGDIGLLRVGILRVDFLGSDVGFLGLARSWNGMWEIRTVDINDTEVES